MRCQTLQRTCRLRRNELAPDVAAWYSSIAGNGPGVRRQESSTSELPYPCSYPGGPRVYRAIGGSKVSKHCRVCDQHSAGCPRFHDSESGYCNAHGPCLCLTRIAWNMADGFLTAARMHNYPTRTFDPFRLSSSVGSLLACSQLHRGRLHDICSRILRVLVVPVLSRARAESVFNHPQKLARLVSYPIISPLQTHRTS